MTGYKIEKAEVYRALLGETSRSLDIDDIIKRIFKNNKANFEDFWKTVSHPGIKRDSTQNRLTIKEKYDDLKREAQDIENTCKSAIKDFDKEISRLELYSNLINAGSILSSGALVLPAAFASVTQSYTLIIAGIAFIVAIGKLLAENFQLTKNRDKYVTHREPWETVKKEAKKYLNFIKEIEIPNSEPEILLNKFKKLSDLFYDVSTEHEPPNIEV